MHTTEINGPLSQRQKDFLLPSNCESSSTGVIPDIEIEFDYSVLKLQVRNILVSADGRETDLIAPQIFNRTASNFTVNSLVTLPSEYNYKYYNGLEYKYGDSRIPAGVTLYSYGVESYNNDTGKYDSVRERGEYGLIEKGLKGISYFMFSSQTHLDAAQRQKTLKTRQVNVNFYYYLDNILIVDYLREGTRSKLWASKQQAFGLHDIPVEISQSFKKYGIKFTRYELFDMANGEDVEASKKEVLSPDAKEGDIINVEYNTKNRHLIEWFDLEGLKVKAEFHDVTGGKDEKIQAVSDVNLTMLGDSIDVDYKLLNYLNYEYTGYDLYEGFTQDSGITESKGSDAKKVIVTNNSNDRLVVFKYILKGNEFNNIIVRWMDEEYGIDLRDQKGSQLVTDGITHIENDEDFSEKSYVFTKYILYNHNVADYNDVTEKGVKKYVDVSDTHNDRLLIFFYKKVERPSIIVKYIEEETGNEIKLEYREKMTADTITHAVPNIEGYDYLRYVLYDGEDISTPVTENGGADKKECVVTNNDNNRLLIIYYKCNLPKPNIIIKHISEMTGEEIYDQQRVYIEKSPMSFDRVANIPGFPIYKGYDLYNHQIEDKNDLTKQGTEADITCEVVDNTEDRILVFRYSPIDIEINNNTPDVDIHDVLIAGEFETNVELKSNSTNLDTKDPRDPVNQEYNVVDEAIPTSEDMYSNVTTSSYTLENYASGEQLTKTLNITLALQYRDNANEGKSEDSTGSSAETGTYTIKTINIPNVQLKYYYLTGRYTILKPLHHAIVKNDAIESWSKDNTGNIVHRDKEVWLYPNWDINLFDMYYKAGGDLVAPNNVKKLSEYGYSSSAELDGKTRDAGNLIPMGLYDFKKVSSDEYSFTWVVEEHEVFAVTGGSASGWAAQARQQAENFLKDYFNNNIALHFKDWLKAQGVKIQTDHLIVYCPDNTKAQGGDIIYNGKPIDFSDEDTDYPELMYREQGFFKYKPTITNRDRLFLKGNDKESIFVRKNTANSMMDSPYLTKADIYFAKFKTINYEVEGDTNNIVTLAEESRKIDDPLQESFKGIKGNNVGVQTPVVDDSHVVRDAIVNQKAVQRTEDDKFTYLQLDGTFSVDIPWKTENETISYKGYGKRDNPDYAVKGYYNSFAGNQTSYNWLKNKPQNSTTDLPNEIAHYEHLGHTYTSWGAIKDVKIPFDTYISMDGVTGFAEGSKLFIPGGVWLSDALLNYTNTRIYGDDSNQYYNGKYDDTITNRLKEIREREGSLKITLTLDQIREFYRKAERLDKEKTSFNYTVPVWVDEIVYKIETRVISENAMDLTNFKEINGRFGSTNPYYSKSRDQYVATKEHYVQVIGLIYDLKVESSEDPDWAALETKDNGSGGSSGKISASFFPFGSTNKSSQMKNDGVLNQQNRNKAYPYAPKLGYSFAFSFKVKGRKSNAINIGIANQKFYFADKAGGIAKEVDLWYKKSNNAPYVKIGDIENANSELLIAPSDSFLKIPPTSLTMSNNIYPGKELVDYTGRNPAYSVDQMFKTLNYSNKVSVGRFDTLTLTHPFRMVYDNMDAYAGTDKLYGTSKDLIIADSILTDKDAHITGGQKDDERVVASVGQWYAGYTLPITTIAVEKDKDPNKGEGKIAQDGYLMVSFGIMTEHQHEDDSNKKTISDYLVYTGPETKYDSSQSLDKEEIDIDWKYVIDKPTDVTGGSSGKLPTTLFGLFTGIRTKTVETNQAYQNTHDQQKVAGDESKDPTAPALNVTNIAQGGTTVTVSTQTNVNDYKNATGVLLEKAKNSKAGDAPTESEIYTTQAYYSKNVDVYLNDNIITSQMITNDPSIYLDGEFVLPNGQKVSGVPVGTVAVIEKNITARQDFSSDIRY